MAVYVVLSFEDDTEAKTFVKSTIIDHQNSIYYVYQDEGNPEYADVAVEGVFKKPTKFCNPTDGHRKKLTGWTRGKKYGWWVCAACGKPSQLATKLGKVVTAFGLNLLPKQLRPEGQYSDWESPHQWLDLLPEETQRP